MKFSKRLICLLIMTILVCMNSIGILANDSIYESFDLIRIDSTASDKELIPTLAKACNNPLYPYFGDNYKIVEDDGLWWTIEGNNGYNGRFNYKTGYGYQINDDGSHTGFYLSGWEE